MYSTMALSPVASERERWTVASLSSPGTFAVTTVKGSVWRGIDGLLNGLELVEHVLCPKGDSEQRLVGWLGILRFDQP